MLYCHKDILHVCAMISNPVRFDSRYELYKRFVENMKGVPNVELHTVEVAFGRREHAVTPPMFGDSLQLRTSEEIWHKENALNLLIQRLPSDWRYMAWIDADVEFASNPKGWALETIQELQHYQFVQPFSNAIDLGPEGEVIQSHSSFCFMYRKGAVRGDGYTFWHPGFAWAARRDAINNVGGLFDKAVLGAGDHHMALSLIGDAHLSLPGKISEGYKNEVLRWQSRAEKYIRRDIGFVPGTIHHHWHGKKKDRKYIERWEILTKYPFDPVTHLKRDWQGLYTWNDVPSGLRDEVRQYFRQRNEDSIDIE